MKNIAITGFMGTGKTTVGIKLANALNWNFIDTDELIEEKVAMSITEIFAKYGEEGFRQKEKEVINDIAEKEQQVISTGGGVVLNQDNIRSLKRSSLVIGLQADSQVIFDRVGQDTSRPLLAGDDPIASINRLLKVREPYYQAADIFIDTSNLTADQVVEIILKELNERGMLDVGVSKC